MDRTREARTTDNTDQAGTERTSMEQRRNIRGVSLGELFRFASFADKSLIFIGSLFAFIEGAGMPAMALVFGGMTNTLVKIVQAGFVNETESGLAAQADGRLTASQFEAEMATISLFYVAIGLAVYLSSLIQVTCWQSSCERQVHRIRRAFFRSILRQELAWFDRHQAGDLASKLNDDVERIRDGMGEQFSSIIKYTSSFISGFVVGLVASWRLTLVILAATPLLAIFSAYLGKMLATSTRREQEKYARAGALAEEVLVAIRTVFALGGQQYEAKQYERTLNESKKMAQWKYFKLAVAVGLSMFVLYSTYGLALYVASLLLNEDSIRPGTAMTVIMSVMMGASALGNVIPPLQTIAMSLSSASLIYDIIDTQPRIDAFNDRALKLSKVTANIKFKNVTFSYPTRPDVPVLKNLNFEINQGQTVAICGKTGSGKSTIMNLLLRFYDPDEGRIYLDKCNLRDQNVAWLRSLSGIVEQEPALFDCSVYENIALGSTHEADKSLERIIEVAKLANAHEFIVNLPDGYGTRCGDRGVQMSGGQKQRIAIARALLCDPKILLLDEATSALDSESEFMVQSALNRARQGRTTIVIAHRLSTIRDADLICVMKDGSIVESGRHDELMERRGEYYSLVTNQVFQEDTGPDGRAPLGDGPDGMAAVGGEVSSNLSGTDEFDSDSNALFESTRSKTSASMRLLERSLSTTTTAIATTTTTTTITSALGRRNQSVSSSYQQRAGALDDTPLARHTDSSHARLLASGDDGSSSKRGPSTTLYESINRPLKGLVEMQDVASERVRAPSLRETLNLLLPERNMLIFSILAAILSGALLPTFALFYAQIFDTLTKTGDELLEAGAFWAQMFVVLAATNFVTMFLRIYLAAYAIENTLARLRSACFTNIMRQNVGWFDASANSPQRLTARLATDVPQIKSIINARFSSTISGVATILTALLIAFYLGWQLAILLTFAIPILLYVGYLQMRMQRGDRAQHTKRMENASRLATEAIEHIKLIQAINQERYFYEKFHQELYGPYKETLSAARRFGFVYGLAQSCIFFVYGAAFRWGAYLMARQELEPITVFRIFFSIAFTAVTVGQWGALGGDMSQANYSIGLIMKLLNTQPTIDNLSRGGIKPRFKGSITFRDVYFRYPTRPDTPVLQGLSLAIKPGQTVALVGPSGRGKSTIASLLLRFYDPDRGVVSIDNYDIRCINLNHLRLNIGLVSQEPCLFKASIKDNILYGLDRTRYTMNDVVRAAKLAHIDDFINSLPLGYATQVGERGTQMSGGQKQRIAIARILIRNPTILVFDEATSALDSESEALVNAALEEAAKGKTCIKIAHRLSTVRDADLIVVLDNGVIVESGTHDQLMQLGKKGFYFKLMQKQDISS